MGVMYSYGDFTTRSHGVIEYANPHSTQDGEKNKKRHKKTSLKYATRWPSAAPLKKVSKPASQKAEQNINKVIDKQCWKIFKQRYPGQLPQKGQIKAIRLEVLKEYNLTKAKELGKPAVQKKKMHSQQPAKPAPSKVDIINELSIAKFRKLYPGQKPTEEDLRAIRQEISEGRKKLGL